MIARSWLDGLHEHDLKIRLVFCIHGQPAKVFANHGIRVHHESKLVSIKFEGLCLIVYQNRGV
jgi:hypothetical protein